MRTWRYGRVVRQLATRSQCCQQGSKLTSTGLTVKYNFNCIIITPKGIFPVDLKAADPLEAAKAGDAEVQGQASTAIPAPNPPVEVGA